MKLITKTQMTQRGPKLSQCFTKQAVERFPKLLSIPLVLEGISHLKAF